MSGLHIIPNRRCHHSSTSRWPGSRWRKWWTTCREAHPEEQPKVHWLGPFTFLLSGVSYLIPWRGMNQTWVVSELDRELVAGVGRDDLVAWGIQLPTPPSCRIIFFTPRSTVIEGLCLRCIFSNAATSSSLSDFRWNRWNGIGLISGARLHFDVLIWNFFYPYLALIRNLSSF